MLTSEAKVNGKKREGKTSRFSRIGKEENGCINLESREYRLAAGFRHSCGSFDLPRVCLALSRVFQLNFNSVERLTLLSVPVCFRRRRRRRRGMSKSSWDLWIRLFFPSPPSAPRPFDRNHLLAIIHLFLSVELWIGDEMWIKVKHFSGNIYVDGKRRKRVIRRGVNYVWSEVERFEAKKKKKRKNDKDKWETSGGC